MRLLLSCLAWALCLTAAAVAQTASPSAGCVPLPIDFTAPSSGTAYWDFGDGVVSDQLNPSHVYTAPGSYTVTFRRGEGGPVVGTTEVRAYAQPTITLAVDDPAGCIPLRTEMSAEFALDDDIAVTSIRYAFGDGASATGPTVRHVYNAPNDYDVTVQLTTSISTCNTTETFEDAVQAFALPAVNFVTSPNPAQSCTLPLTVAVSNRTTGAGPIDYAWDFGNGTTSNEEAPDPVVYTERGAFDLTLTATDANGCQSSLQRPVSAGPPDPNFGLPDTVCFDQVYTVRAASAADTYDWTFGPGILVLTDSNDVQLLRFSEAGPTTVGLSVTNAAQGCSADTTRTIFVQRPFVDAIAEPAYSCSSPYTVVYTIRTPALSAGWAFADNGDELFSTQFVDTVTFTYDEGGVYGQNWYELQRARARITTAQGCVADTTIVGVIDLPNALFMPDVAQGCAPLTVTFADSVRSTLAVTDYYIDWGDGSTETFTAAGPWVHTYDAPGEYEPFIAVANEGGCVDTSYSLLIEVGEPIAGLSFDAELPSLCTGDTLTFTSTTDDDRVDAINFSVEGVDDHHCLDETTLRAALTRPVEGEFLDYTYTVEYNGCLAEVTDSVAYTQPPLARLDWAVECEAPYDFRFYNGSVGSATDSLVVTGDSIPGGRLAFLIADSLDVTLPARGAYDVRLVAAGGASGCPAHVDSARVYVTEPVAEFDVPLIQCAGDMLLLDGSASQDVNAVCAIGYQWDFSWTRPHVSANAENDDVQVGGRLEETIDLIVEDINNCVDTTTRRVRVFATTLSPLASDARICLPATVDFTLGVQADTTVTSYMWDFGGFGTSDERNPSFTFSDFPGSDTLTQIEVTVSSMDEAGCSGGATLILDVYRPEADVFLSVPTGLICAGDEITYTATDFTAEGSNLAYSWGFEGGAPAASQNRIETVTYPDAGTYDVTLDYVEVASGCSADTALTITVQEAPVLSFGSTIDGGATVCAGDLVTFFNTSPNADDFTPVWFVPGGSGTVADSVTVALPRGTSEIRLLGITSAGCQSEIAQTYDVVGPFGTFTFSPDDICVGDEVTFVLQDTIDFESWTWDFGNGQTEQNTNPATATYTTRPPSGQTTVSLSYEATFGVDVCAGSFTDTLSFGGAAAGFVTDDGDSTACDLEVMFIDQSVGAATYAYDFGAGGATSTEASPTFTFPGPGTYLVTQVVTDDRGSCADTFRQEITVLPDLALTLTAEPICAGDVSTVVLGASRALSDVAFSPDGFLTQVGQNTFVTPVLNESTTLSVSVVDSFNCSAEVSGVVVEVGGAFPGAADTLTVLAGTEVTLPVENPGGFTFAWSDPEAVGCDDCDNPTFVPEMSRDYTLVVTPVAGEADCPAITLVFRVILIDEPVIPNLFSPNGDGTNDDWGPLLPEGFEPAVTTYRVFSRWGSVVFEADDVTARWNGEDDGDGTELPSDTYAYVIKLVYPDGTNFNAAGEVTLLR